MKIELFADVVPKTAENFRYDGLIIIIQDTHVLYNTVSLLFAGQFSMRAYTSYTTYTLM